MISAIIVREGVQFLHRDKVSLIVSMGAGVGMVVCVGMSVGAGAGAGVGLNIYSNTILSTCFQARTGAMIINVPSGT